MVYILSKLIMNYICNRVFVAAVEFQFLGAWKTELRLAVTRRAVIRFVGQEQTTEKNISEIASPTWCSTPGRCT